MGLQHKDKNMKKTPHYFMISDDKISAWADTDLFTNYEENIPYVFMTVEKKIKIPADY